MASLELDNMEYSSDANAQAAYVTSDSAITQQNTIGGNDLIGAYPEDHSQGFKVSTADPVTRITIPMKKQAGAVGTFTVCIYSDDGTGKPNALLTTFSPTVDVSTLTTDFVAKDFYGLFIPTANTQYHIVRLWTGGSGTAQAGENATNTNPYANGVVCYNIGAGWVQLTSYDMVFNIYQGDLASASEATIKTQDSYSLKAVAVATDSLNKTLTKTFATNQNLTGVNALKLDMRASRTGANIKLGLRNNIGLDSYTKLLLHCDGLDTSTTFTDETGKTVTANGNAQIDTAQSKFGGASGLFDTSGDYLSIADSDDWNFGTGDFTIDFWMRRNTINVSNDIFSQKTDVNNQAFLYFDQSGNIIFRVYSGGANVVDMTQASAGWSTGTWYHVAVVRNGSNWNIYRNGTSVVNQTTSITYPDFTGAVTIGGQGIIGASLDGWIDEFRVSKGIARWTSNFTPPVQSYINTIELTPTINTADTYQTVKWDLSVISDANKNAIDKFIITVVNADAANTFYIDNFNIVAQVIDVFGWVN